MLTKFIELSEAAIDYVSCDYVRPHISFLSQKERLIGIKGSRGVGKSTLLLQYAKTQLKGKERLYVSLDNPFFAKTDLFEFASEFVKNGGEYLLLDEVHHYEGWSLSLKMLYDNFPSLKTIYTGSSLLHLIKGRADLSRRSMVYTLPGLSLREYINLTSHTSFAPKSIEEILSNHQKIAKEILTEIKPIKKYNEYIVNGYYPFFLENPDNYLQKLMQTLNLLLETDLPLLTKINYTNVNKLKHLMQFIAESVPFKPNWEKISRHIGISKNTLKEYLYYLQEALLVFLLKTAKTSSSRLSKPEKIYLFHPNLMFCMTNGNANAGTVRETFFINQLQTKHTVNYSETGDFLIDNKIVFEIGGKNKSFEQIAGVENSFIAADSIEIGYKNTIPLWLFGFLY